MDSTAFVMAEFCAISLMVVLSFIILPFFPSLHSVFHFSELRFVVLGKGISIWFDFGSSKRT